MTEKPPAELTTAAKVVSSACQGKTAEICSAFYFSRRLDLILRSAMRLTTVVSRKPTASDINSDKCPQAKMYPAVAKLKNTKRTGESKNTLLE
jgi:hypothetical protein